MPVIIVNTLSGGELLNASLALRRESQLDVRTSKKTLGNHHLHLVRLRSDDGHAQGLLGVKVFSRSGRDVVSHSLLALIPDWNTMVGLGNPHLADVLVAFFIGPDNTEPGIVRCFGIRTNATEDLPVSGELTHPLTWRWARVNSLANLVVHIKCGMADGGVVLVPLLCFLLVVVSVVSGL